MREEVQLETLAQDLVVHFADPALPRRTGIRDKNISTAETPCGRSKCALDGSVRGDIARHGQTAEFVRERRDHTFIKVEQHDLGPCRPKGPGRSLPDGAACAGNNSDLARQRCLLRAAQLGLLQRPVFDFEGIGLGNRAELADTFCRRYHLNIVLINIRRDIGGPG